jgi:hypothetical protein
MPYDVRCVTTSRTDYGSVHVCSILEDGEEVEVVNFRVLRRRGGKELIPEGGSEFNKAFFELFGGRDPMLRSLLRGRQRRINDSLELLVKMLIESGYWKPKAKPKRTVKV